MGRTSGVLVRKFQAVLSDVRKTTYVDGSQHIPNITVQKEAEVLRQYTVQLRRLTLWVKSCLQPTFTNISKPSTEGKFENYIEIPICVQ